MTTHDTAPWPPLPCALWRPYLEWLRHPQLWGPVHYVCDGKHSVTPSICVTADNAHLYPRTP